MWKTHNAGEDIVVQPPIPGHHDTGVAPPHAPPPHTAPPIDQGDVTADLARDDARRNDTYQTTADHLIAQVNVARTAWPGTKQRELDANLGELQHAVDAAPIGRARDKALRNQIKYLEDALVREEVALR